jgi:hypothetical protein
VFPYRARTLKHNSECLKPISLAKWLEAERRRHLPIKCARMLTSIPRLFARGGLELAALSIFVGTLRPRRDLSIELEGVEGPGLNTAGSSGFIRPRAAALLVASLLQLHGSGCDGRTVVRVYPSLPWAIGLASLPGWLRAHTDIAPSSVVYLSGGVALILQDKGLRGGAGQRTEVVVRREALSAGAVAAIRGRSERFRLEFDCAASQYRLLGDEIYAGNALTGSELQVTPRSTSFTVKPNTDGEFLQRALCDPAYVAPLSGLPQAHTIAGLGADPTTGPRPRQAARAATFVDQVSASESKALAHALLADLARRNPQMANLPMKVEAVDTGGGTRFKALIGGFSARSQAETLCANLRTAGQSCWVRYSPGKG